jgi:hypothetical protein
MKPIFSIFHQIIPQFADFIEKLVLKKPVSSLAISVPTPISTMQNADVKVSERELNEPFFFVF